ncbi:MAG: flagellar M-ring protein FliF [Myxococcales bacterium]|nr:flagellar M-ring protein FliF [Myxococcales bacterium]
MSEQENSSLPPAVRALFVKVQARLLALSKAARIGLVVGIVVFGTLAALLFVRVGRETYAPLFTQLDRDDAAALVAKLKEMKVPYRLIGDGTGVEVPEARVHELRLDLAAAGLPRGGGVGFESFDKMKLGATEFEQRVLYRRALEGELARTVGSLSAVQSARVHLVLPERSVFVSKNEPASASVVVKMRPGRALSAGEIAGVVHLCAAAVPGLAADRVALVTTEGTMLHRPRAEGAEGGTGLGDTDQLTAARALEATLEDRARAMLEKLVGPGHVDVRVSAELDLSRLERLQDQFDQAKVALRSETKTIEQNGGVVDTVAGIPGAESNLPGGAGSASAGPAASGAPGRLSLTRNWEVSRITEKRIVTGGVLKRLTVAVVVDGAKHGDLARTPEELAKLTALVRGAIGLDDKRGDVLTVESVPFLPVEVAPNNESGIPANKSEWLLGWFKKLPKKVQLGIGGGVLLLVLTVVFFVLRGARRVFKKSTAMVLDAVAAGNASYEEAHPTPAKKTVVEIVDYRTAAVDRAARDPATAALVLRGWLGTLEQKNPVPAQTA